MNRIVRPGYSHGLVSMFSDLTLLLDPLSLLAAAWLSTLLSRHWLLPAQMSAHGGSDLVQAALIAAVLAPFVLYDRHFGAQASRGRMAVLAHSHALRFSMFAAVMFGLGVASRTLNDFPRGWLVSWFVASLVLTSLSRVLMANTVRRLQRQGMLSEVVAVVGAGPVADRLVQLLRQTLPQSIELLGIFDDRAERLPSKATRPVGTLQQLIELGKTRKIDWIVLTLPPTAQRRLTVTLQRLKALSVPIGLCPQHVGLSESYQHIDYVGDSVPVSLLADRPIKRWDAVFKGAEDLLIGGLITLLLLPLLGLIALAIKLDGRGPVLFTQRRHAVDNREFEIYKFRTMRWDPAGADTALQQTLRDDQRITRVGRFLRATSLDELPQLFNVLRGEMSLVGPRPHAISMQVEDRANHDIVPDYALRHHMKPGITGWAQVNGYHGPVATEDALRARVRYDLEYINNWSLWFDLQILARTVTTVLGQRHAF